MQVYYIQLKVVINLRLTGISVSGTSYHDLLWNLKTLRFLARMRSHDMLVLVADAYSVDNWTAALRFPLRYHWIDATILSRGMLVRDADLWIIHLFIMTDQFYGWLWIFKKKCLTHW